jgi:uncharacterized protein YdeI (YjbR/CyaY-like superfamily)
MARPSQSSEKRRSLSLSDGLVEFFTSVLELHQWLDRNHMKETALRVGFYKKKTEQLGVTYQGALDEALCFGWIDGVRKSIDQGSYMIRFSPRKPKSIWSAVNIKRVEELTKLGRMQDAGMKAFAQRLPENQNRYSYEKGDRSFDQDFVRRFKENKKAWHFFEDQPAGYRRTATWWVMSAKREETKLKRLAILIGDSERAVRISAVTGRQSRPEI